MQNQNLRNITIKNLKKTFPSGFQLGPIDVNFSGNSVYVLLGKNGAGKTTLFQLLTGSLDSSDGEILFEKDRMLPESFGLKRRIGYLPQNMNLPKWVTPRELLNYACGLYGLDHAKDRVKKEADFWDCTSFLDTPLSACSYGMSKRAGLALAHIHEPAVLILDEPTSGLDIYHIKALDLSIAKRRSSEKITIICTHDSHHAARSGDFAYIMDRGSLKSIDAWPEAGVLDRISMIEHEFFGGN